ncbi:hypothetical protein CLOHYLEM_04063 [[Clostridium] hylemonae DSM 15053]|uniref:Uncharacterized protein n=1 Tax=[Clostridium] hylemonae DSM 15053 TaxID=553973 RepID=C0BW34_9FIRM|nr:hypothetical protein CLOHYLEM_04063 [[Clostridium] hylemonae DSM 15053]
MYCANKKESVRHSITAACSVMRYCSLNTPPIGEYNIYKAV